MKLTKVAGATSEIWQVFIQDSSSTTGAGLTGLAFNSSSLAAYYHRDTDTTATAITLVTMTVGTFTSSGFKEIDATHMPGWYQFCPPNAAIAASAKSCGFHLQGATNMAPLAIEVQLAAVNPDSATAFVTSVASVVGAVGSVTGLTASDVGAIKTKTDFLPGAAAGAAGGVFIAGTNAATTITTGLTTHLIGTVDTLTTYTGNTPQTGDGYAVVNSGTFGNSAIKTVVDAIDGFVDTEVASILVDSSTTLSEIDARLTAALGTALQAHALGLGRVVVDAGSSTTTVVFKTINGAAASGTNDFYNGRVLIFTSGALTLQATSISGYVGSTKTATVVAMTGTPVSDVTAILT